MGHSGGAHLGAHLGAQSWGTSWGSRGAVLGPCLCHMDGNRRPAPFNRGRKLPLRGCQISNPPEPQDFHQLIPVPMNRRCGIRGGEHNAINHFSTDLGAILGSASGSLAKHVLRNFGSGTLAWLVGFAGLLGWHGWLARGGGPGLLRLGEPAGRSSGQLHPAGP